MIKGDDGDKAVEMLLKQTEQEIIKIYDEASKGCYAKLQKHLRAFERKDAEKRKLKDAGVLSEDEYNRWKHGQIMIGQRWQNMVSVLAEDMVNADKLAVSVINGHIPEAYAINANYGTYQIEHGLGIDTSFVLYDRHTVERLIRDDPDLYPAPNPKVDIPKDRRWNKKQINSQVTQAILQGEPVKTLAKRIFPEIAGKAGEGSTPKKNAIAAMRTARTAMTGAQNAGRVAAYSRAEELGIQMLQEWVSAHDGHTRESHLDVDGEQVPVGYEFSNECRYPGDPGGPPEEVYNCRCTLVPALKSLGQIKDKDYKPSEREIDITAYEEDKEAHKMSFTEWLTNRKEAQEKKDKDYGEGVNGAPEQYQNAIKMKLNEASDFMRGVWNKVKQAMKAPMFDLEKGAHFSPRDGATHYESENEAFGKSSYQEEYSVYFHEFGHNIDHLLQEGLGSYYSVEYNNGEFGKTIRSEIENHLLEYYIDSNISSKHNEWVNVYKAKDDISVLLEQSKLPGTESLSSELKGALRRSLRGQFDLRVEISERMDKAILEGDEKTIRGIYDTYLSKDERLKEYAEYYKDQARGVVERLSRSQENALSFCSAVRERYNIYERSDISDMFDGYLSVKCNVESGMGVGHGREYFENPNALPIEAFAEMYSATMTKTASLDTIKTFFPQSYSVFEKMLSKAVKEG